MNRGACRDIFSPVHITIILRWKETIWLRLRRIWLLLRLQGKLPLWIILSKTKGINPWSSRTEGDVQSGSLTISPVGMEYDEFYVNNIDFPYTVYMVDGLYKYGVQPAYNPPMYFEVEHGLVNTAKTVTGFALSIPPIMGRCVSS